MASKKKEKEKETNFSFMGVLFMFIGLAIVTNICLVMIAKLRKHNEGVESG